MALPSCFPGGRQVLPLIAALTLVVSSIRADDPPKTPSADATPSAVENAVVKIFATIRRPDLIRPWTKLSPTEVSGSGVVIDGKRILTNAHVVLYASQVQVQANQSGDKLSAIVDAVAPGIDLAVLRLEDASFFDTHPPLARATALPEVKDTVLAYGYPTGGTNLSITKGIVSRIEFVNYNYPVAGLRVQIDAAINPGNSGGPAVSGDKMIGLAFSHLANAQNIGYIIPMEEIELFLSDVANGKSDGKPALFAEYQPLENDTLRAYLNLDKTVTGVVVRDPYDETPSYPLKHWDVIEQIGDAPIDNQGMVKTDSGLRVRFTYLVQKLAHDGRLPLTILRGGKTLSVQVPVSPDRPRLLPYLHGTAPSYFVFGPLVFSNATEDFVNLHTASTNNGLSWNATLSFSGNPLLTRRSDKPAFPGEQLVVVSSPLFPHKLGKGYSNPALHVVASMNGVAVKNLAHLVELLRDATSEHLVFSFAGHPVEDIVLPRVGVRLAQDDILNEGGVRFQGSPDMLAIWNAKTGAK
jgi:S1-C subfamily serine protease